MQSDIETELWPERKLHGIRRKDRPRCGAKTRAGTPCQAQALENGRCFLHGGLSTGPRTPEGKARQAQAARERMLARWAKWRAEGKPLSEEGRETLRANHKATMEKVRRKRAVKAGEAS
jgi:hypothetical protein